MSSDLQSREGREPSKFIRLIRGEPSKLTSGAQPVKGSIAVEKRKADFYAAVREAEARILEEAEMLAGRKLNGLETQEELTHRGKVLRAARNLYERQKRPLPEYLKDGGEEQRAPEHPEEAEWKGEPPPKDEIISERTLPVMGAGEGLRAYPIMGPDGRPLTARFSGQQIRPGDFLEYVFSGAIRQRLMVCSPPSSFPQDAICAALLCESPNENDFAEEIMRLRRPKITKFGGYATRKAPRVWRMEVSEKEGVLAARLRDSEEVVREAEELLKKVNENTEALVDQLFERVPVSSK